MGYAPTDPEIRFRRFAQVDASTGCWLWQGCVVRSGYGNFWTPADGTIRAHRWAYRHFVGPIPEGMQLDHLCRTRRCVNPDHLEAVTPRVNVLRGDTMPARNHAKTGCKQGHPYAPDNLYIDPRGYRECRTCRRQAGAEHVTRRRQVLITKGSESIGCR